MGYVGVGGVRAGVGGWGLVYVGVGGGGLGFGFGFGLSGDHFPPLGAVEQFRVRVRGEGEG